MKRYDPREPLQNARHEEFVQFYIGGMARTDAYMKAYPDSARNGARMNSWRLINENEKVISRVRHLLNKNKESVELDIRWNKNKAVDFLITVINDSEEKTKERLMALDRLNDLMKINEKETKTVDDRLKSVIDKMRAKRGEA